MDTTAEPIALTPERLATGDRAAPIAIVGLACRFPDADDPLALFESALAGRRAFRRMPPGRAGAGPGRHPGRDGLTAGRPRAALLEGWEFDRAAYGITEASYRAADPAHWLALETAGGALADAGFPGGQGLATDRAAVIIGNTLTGEIARTVALRSQWPFVAAVLSQALAARDVPAGDRAAVLGHAAAAFAAPLPGTSAATLAGAQPGAIADRISRHFQFRGGGYAVDTAHASSLLAVATACALLAAGELDFVLAGGVDISLDPFELSGLGLAGVLAAGAMRIYDASPTGFLPGEGCGMVALMRADDAIAAGMPRYADIAGWGIASAGRSGPAAADAGTQLLALQRAYQRAQVDPADIQLIEGDGRGTADADLAELTALSAIRSGATAAAALGSVKANIGHTKAAAGAAGLIKAALAVNAGVIPPTTGCGHPHPVLADQDAMLRVPGSAERWPGGHRLAAVTATDPAGSTVHVVLRRERNQGSGPGAALPPPRPGTPATAGDGTATARDSTPPTRDSTPPTRDSTATGGHLLATWSVPRVPRAEVFAFSGPDREAVAAALRTVAGVAPGLSDSELSDLASQLGRTAEPGPVRVALVAATQEELARLCADGAALLPGLEPGRLAARPGLFAADRAAGRVVLLFPGEAAVTAGGHDSPERVSPSALAQASLAALRWLDALGLRAAAGVGVGVGEITALTWAGSLAQADAATLIAERAAILSAMAGQRTALICVTADEAAVRALPAAAGLAVAGCYGPRCHILGGAQEAVATLGRQAAQAGIQARPLDLPYALHSPAMSDAVAPLRAAAARARLTAPARRVISTVTASEVTAGTDLATLLAGQLTSPVRLAAALSAAAAGADLLLDTGPGQALATLAAGCCAVPAVSLGNGPDSAAAPGTTAALFAAGAIGTLVPLLSGRPSRPFDIARTPRFLTNPCAVVTAEPAAGHGPAGQAAADAPPAELPPAGRPGWGPAAPGPASRPWRAGSRVRPGGPLAGRPPASGLAATGPYGTPGSGAAAADGAVPGVAPWVRCFAEELRPLPLPAVPGDEEPWRLHATTRQPFGRMAAEVFEDDPAADGVLAVIGDLADPDGTGTLLAAAREAARAGSFVVITPAAGLEGFCAGLHAEHPSLGLTLIRTTDSMTGLIAAQRFAATQPGHFRHVVLEAAGEPRQPVMEVLARGDTPTARGDTPPARGSSTAAGRAAMAVPGGLPAPAPGRADVVLIAGEQPRDLLAAAGVLAGSGVRLALIGPPDADEPAAVDLALAGLRRGGAEVSYLQADLTDPDEADAAVASVEQRIGPVTVVCYVAGAGPASACSGLSASDLRARMARQADGLRSILGSVNEARLRLLLTAGRAAARYGAAGQCGPALLAGALAEQGRRLEPGLPGCRIVHADWDPDLAAPAEVGRLLRDVVASGQAPDRVAIHGRLGPGAAGFPARRAGLEPGPGPEPVPGPVPGPGPRPQAGRDPRPQPGPGPRPQAGREAGLAGGRFLERVRVHYPGVELVTEAGLSLRSDPYLGDYQLDGLAALPPAIGLEAMAQAASALAGRPLRRLAGAAMDVPVLLPPSGTAATLRVCALRTGDAVETVLRYSGSGFHLDHFRAAFPLEEAPGPAGLDLPGEPARDRAGRPALALTDPGGVVDGTDLYGPVCFQAGSFRRVAFLPGVTARSCRALVRGADDRPWFSGPAAGRGPLILGSPGLNDALMHVLQACVPHRRVLPAGFESFACTGQEVRGAVSVQAGKRADGGWDVTALDATGHPVLAVTRLRLRDVGPLEHHAPWHPTLLAAALEAQGTELGLDPSLRATVRCGQPPATGSRPAGPSPAGPDPAGAPDGLPWLDRAVGTGPLAGYELTVRASQPIACYWATAGNSTSTLVSPGSPTSPEDLASRGSLTGPERLASPEDLARQLHDRGRGDLAAVSTRVRAITACLTAAAWSGGTPLQLDDAHDGEWIRVRAGSITVACTATRIDGVPQPIVIALATWPGTAHQPADPGMLTQGAPRR